MTDAGTKARLRYQAAMAQIDVGAVLARRSRHWTVVAARRWYTSVELTLRSGRREIRAHVMVGHYGPDLACAGLRVVSPPPTQRVLGLPLDAA